MVLQDNGEQTNYARVIYTAERIEWLIKIYLFDHAIVQCAEEAGEYNKSEYKSCIAATTFFPSRLSSLSRLTTRPGILHARSPAHNMINDVPLAEKFIMMTGAGRDRRFTRYHLTFNSRESLSYLTMLQHTMHSRLHFVKGQRDRQIR